MLILYILYMLYILYVLYIYIYIYIYISSHKWSTTHRVFKSHSSKINVIYMLLLKQCALPVITPMAHGPKCMSCHKAIAVITGSIHCFHDSIYIYIYIYIYILYIYMYACMYVYIFIIITVIYSIKVKVLRQFLEVPTNFVLRLLWKAAF